MIYILIAVIFVSNGGGSSAISVEFNSKEACMTAATMYSQQSVKTTARDGMILFCAAKGVKDGKD